MPDCRSYTTALGSSTRSIDQSRSAPASYGLRTGSGSGSGSGVAVGVAEGVPSGVDGDAGSVIELEHADNASARPATAASFFMPNPSVTVHDTVARTGKGIWFR